MIPSHEKPLTAWQRVKLARHPERPYTLDYVRLIFSDFIELRGDRQFRDDRSLVGGLARFEGRTVMIVGMQKGRSIKENLERNFGMPHPEGYRKAARLMKHAEKFGFPVLTFIDTPGASPDIQAEERGQAVAIAENLMVMAQLQVPIIATIIGEGNSGGALAVGVSDRILMLENSYFSVVSPEGCASILWRDSSLAPQAAEAMRITATDLLRLGIIDGLIPEPAGGAHEDPRSAADALRAALHEELAELSCLDTKELLARRHAKYRAIGWVLDAR